MRQIRLEWSTVRWYRATVDLDDPQYRTLTIEDFRAPPGQISDPVHEALTDLEAGPHATCWQTDGTEISIAEPTGETLTPSTDNTNTDTTVDTTAAGRDPSRFRLTVGPAKSGALDTLLALSDTPGQDARFEYRILRQTGEGRWVAWKAETAYSTLDEARDAGQAEWRKHVGPLYTEITDGPVIDNEIFGLMQISRGYRRIFRRALTDGTHHAVIVVETAVVNNAADNSGPEKPVLTKVVSYTRCTDPDNHQDTEVGEPVNEDTQFPTAPGAPVPGDNEAYRLCAEADPASFDWDGQPRA